MKNNSRYNCLEETLTPDTIKHYRRDVERFWAWAAASKGVKARRYPIKVDLVLDFLHEHIRGLKPAVVAKMAKMGHKVTTKQLACSTLKTRFTAINVEYMARNLRTPSYKPAIKLALIRAWRGAATPKRILEPITHDILIKLLKACGPDLRGKRDRAILLVGYAGGGRRRSELVRLQVEHLRKVKGGFVGRLPIHKTLSFTKRPLIFPILGPAADALDEWLKAANITSGNVFRGIHRSGRIYSEELDAKTINRIIKRLCTKAGIEADNFGAHSLRAGFMTQATSDGIPFTDIMQISGHRSVEAAAKYLRPVHMLQNRAAWLSSTIKDTNAQSENHSVNTLRRYKPNKVNFFTVGRKIYRVA